MSIFFIGDKWMRHHGMLSVENAPLNVLQLSTEKKEQDMEHLLAQLPHANVCSAPVM